MVAGFGRPPSSTQGALRSCLYHLLCPPRRCLQAVEEEEEEEESSEEGTPGQDMGGFAGKFQSSKRLSPLQINSTRSFSNLYS